MLPMLQKEVVNGRHWATDEELMDYYAIGQCTGQALCEAGNRFREWGIAGLPAE